MTQWQKTLNLKDVFHAGLAITELAGIVAKRLRAVSVPGNDDRLEEERDNIADCFADLADDASATAEDFDNVMAELYDWADTPLDAAWNGKKLCWVKTQ